MTLRRSSRTSTGTLHGSTLRLVRIRLSDLKRCRPQLGVESTRLIKIVCGHHYQPEEAHSKGARAPRPMGQRAGKQQRGENNKTTRANKRGKTGREQKNGTRRGDTHTQRHLSRVPHLHACEAQSRPREKGPSGGLVKTDAIHENWSVA